MDSQVEIWEATIYNLLTLPSKNMGWVCHSEELHEVNGNFWHTSICYSGCYIPTLYRSHLIQQNMSSRLRNSLGTDFWNHVQYHLLASKAGGKSCWTLLLYMCCFKSFVAQWTENFDTPLWRASQDKDFSGVCLILSTSIMQFLSYWNTVFSYFHFVQHWTSHSEHLHYSVYCSLTWHFWYGFFLQNFWQHFFNDILEKVLQMNTLCLIEYISYTLITYSIHDWAPVTRSTDDNHKTTWVGSLKQLTSVFSGSWGCD